MADMVIELGHHDDVSGAPNSSSRLASNYSDVVRLRQANPHLGETQRRFDQELGNLRQVALHLSQVGEGGILATLLEVVGQGIAATADAIGFPASLIAEKVPGVIAGLAASMQEVPVVGALVADILTAADILVATGIPIPATVKATLGGMLDAFDMLPEEMQQELRMNAEVRIRAKAEETDQVAMIEQALALGRRFEQEQRSRRLIRTVAGVGIPSILGIILAITLTPVVGPAGAVAIGVTTAGGGIGLASVLDVFS